ncbi:DUF6414 family protein [Lentilactobacillus senioris]|uniref:DUF6414 family protein n=1 Tax=Lentilactobacillus senioris TaxID=931534 RepID=UPI003D2AFA96
MEKIIKPVYFDEESAIDYLTIINKGVKQTKTEKGDDLSNSEDLSVNLGLSPKLAKLFSFIGSGSVGAEISHSGQRIISSSVTNAVLSDFINCFPKKDRHENVSGVSIFTNYIVHPVKDSIAYYQAISPYMYMTNGTVDINDENITVDVSKIYDALKLGKGYYELVASREEPEDTCIFRFNNDAFVHNYGIGDLFQMNLVYYAINVGEMNADDLNFENYIDSIVDDEVIMTKFPDESDSSQTNMLKMYDVVLAGASADV